MEIVIVIFMVVLIFLLQGVYAFLGDLRNRADAALKLFKLANDISDEQYDEIVSQVNKKNK